MAGPILTAVARGFSSRTILNHIVQRYPQYAQGIMAAQAAGFTPERILQRFNKDENSDDSDQYLTEFEQARKNDKKNKRDAAIKAVSLAGTAGALAAGGYALSQRGQAIRPSAILPAQRQGLPPPGQGGQTINVNPRGPRPGSPASPTGNLPAPQQQRGLSYNPPAPSGPRSSGVSGPKGNLPIYQNKKGLPYNPQTPQGPRPSPRVPPRGLTPLNPEQSINLIRNIGEETRVANIIKQGFDVATAASILRKVIPKEKVALLEKAEGGFEKILQDYIESNPPELRQQTQPQGLPGQTPQIQPQGQQLPQDNFDPTTQQAQPGAQQQPQITQVSFDPTMQPEEPLEEEALFPVDERISEAAFSENPELKRLVDSSFKGKNFSVPHYRYAGESETDFESRRVMNNAVKKAAKAITEGQSFMDFPVTPEALKGVGGYSVAEDVLRFLAGIPNVYNPLLDEDEKQELFDGLLESGGTTVEGLRPSPGATNIHGAQMTPNLIWNLLLSVEPKLTTIERPNAIKGATMKGEKMDTTGFRRFLTHGVYGVLSGKSLPPDLSDKIEKISQASSVIDVIVNASKEGKFRKVQETIDRLANDDEELFALIADEIDRFEESRIPEEKKGASDTRTANQLIKLREDRAAGIMPEVEEKPKRTRKKKNE